MANTESKYANPRLECDVIMKGGITSGVIYPGVLTEFATTYRFRGLGGASAGAIGAAFGAAAELGRRRGGFEKLEQVPTQLRDGALGRLFQPNARTRVLFDVMTDAVAKDADGGSLPASRRVARALTHIAARLWPATVVWAIIGIVWVVIGALWGATLAGLVIASALVLTLIGWVVTVAVLLLRRLSIDGVGNSFGICTGMHEKGSDGPGFTEWLSDTVDWLAGMPAHTTPLTFGHLKNGLDPEHPEPEHKPISLLMMTSCLSRGRPYELPFRTHEYYFDPVEWRRLFPEYVVSYLEQRADASPDHWDEDDTGLALWNWETEGAKTVVERSDSETAAAAVTPLAPEDTRLADVGRDDIRAEAGRLAPRSKHPVLRRLPTRDALPVVVAMRMSLSFPALISAVPLWVVRYNRRTRLAQKAHRSGDVGLATEIGYDYERLWFSDGGLCSNFPIHLFDAPIPSRPTFGINLDRFESDQQRNPDEGAEFAADAAVGGVRPWTNYVYARDNKDELAPTYRPIDDGKGGLAAIKAFALGALDTSRNWQDNAYLKAPGYRDRIIRIRQTRDEGGMNLTMSGEVIQRLVKRGGYAARALTRQYTTPVYERKARNGTVRGFTGWDNHRWIRYRALIGALPTFLAGYRRGHAELAGVDPAHPPSFDVTARTRALDAVIDAALSALDAQIWTDDALAQKVRDDIAANPRGSGTLRRTIQL